MSSIPPPIPSSGSKRPVDSTSDFNSTSVRAQKHHKNDGGSPSSGPSCIQFLVRIISSNRPPHVVSANADDQISSVLEKIESLTGVPLDQVRIITQGKENLNGAKSENDVVLHQVVRLKHFKLSARALEQVNDIVHHAMSLYNFKSPHLSMSAIEQLGKDLKRLVMRFLITAMRDGDNLPEYLNLFSRCSGPQSLVMLQAFSSRVNAYFGASCICMFTHFIGQKSKLPEKRRYRCLPVVIEFCMLLHKVKGINDNLYSECRDCMLKLLGDMHENVMEEEEGLVCHHFIEYVVELAGGILRQLKEGDVMTQSSHLDFRRNLSDFSEFMFPLMKKLKHCAKLGGRFGVDFNTEACTLPGELVGGIIRLRKVFIDLLSTLEKHIFNVEAQERFVSRYYLKILRELHSISQLYPGCEKLFWETMNRRNDDFCYLIITYGGDMKDSTWFQNAKRPSKFELRRDLALMMIPSLNDGRKYEMLIDRSHLLTASYNYIGLSSPQKLRAGLSIQFKDEEALGFGVIREWFLLVCEALFNPKMGLFAACPNNRRRFFPNTESALDPLHLQYFRFSGRIIALALMHRVQVGVALDRIFFLHLAGYNISLDDIQDADPVLYSSYKKILEMDPAILDQDEMALTFTHEIERFGTRKVVELCPGGSSIVVNSENRKQYVDSLINERFIKAISEQVAHFTKGIADLMGYNSSPKYFFRRLCPEDLDLMLHGNESEICLEDWQAHTDYNGFEASDDHISWFWKIVRGMSKEQKRTLLFFWTSVKYLPFEGFSGLDSRLSIIKKTPESTSESLHHYLPSSHTCFFQLCFPGYVSFNVMRDSFHKITQEDISCGFGDQKI